MKLTHIAQVLTLALLVVTTYLAMQARNESVKSRAADEQRAVQMTQQLQAIAAQSAATVTLPPAIPTPALAAIPAPTPAPVHVAPRPSSTASAGPVALPEPKPAPASAGSPAPPIPEPRPATPKASSPAPVPALADVPLTPLQRRVKNSPSLGKVKEFQPDQGFVVLSAGSKQGLKPGLTLDLRRDASVVGRIIVSSVEDTESVADVNFKSVPAGVTILPGDEIIGVVLAQ